MLRRPPISTRTYTPFPYTTLFRSSAGLLEGLLRDVRRPLFLTLAARDDRRLDTLSGAQIIRLPPLDEDEVRHAIGSIFAARDAPRSEEHTSELQSLMRISYAVFCLKKKKNTITPHKPALSEA